MSKIHKPASAPGKPLRLLIADDDPNDLELCLRDLEKSDLDFQADSAFTREEFAKKLREEPADVVVSDYRMKGWTALDALAMIQESWPGVPLILVSGTLGDELAVECIKKGVTDYVLKGQLARLPTAIRHAQEGRALREAELRALEALRESEEHYRTLVENAPEAIVLLDIERQKFVDSNGRALSLFGLTRDALLQSGVRDVSATTQVDGATTEMMERLFAEPGSNGATAHFEWMYRNAQGEEHPAEVYLVRLPSANRRLVRASIVDITDRKRSEQALRDSEARYRGLVDNATYGILWVEEHGGRLLDANPAVAAMLRYESVDDLLSIQFTKTLYCNPDDQKTLIAEYRQQGRAHGTVEWKRKDGKVVAARLSSRRAMNPDGSECAEVIVEDVTEHKALERQLVQAQKFEAIGQLAGGIAHDFNNMIGAILGWVDLGLDETYAASRLHRHFEKVRHQAERAAALTRQLLAFARRQILEPRNVDLNQTTIETLSLLEKVIGSNIEIKANLAPDLAVVRADPTQVEQVLMNLCIN
ncbi:MAG: PAS domain S-box protein, partial [Candidatus Sulfotelmatobacter sp.]